MIKSILKGTQQTQGSKSTLTKAPLRVTFTVEEQETQKGSIATTEMSWMDGSVSTQPSQSEQPNKQEKPVRKGQFWTEESEFKRENISWNGFVLVFNPKFTLDSFKCGKCEQSFVRVADFAFHCLTECAQISHTASSHFIFAETDWQRFVDQQRRKKTLPPPQTSNSTQTPFQTRMQEVISFTKTTLNFWRETSLEETFTFDQHYIYEFGLVLLLNPIHEDYSKLQFLHGKRECPCYKVDHSPDKRQLYLTYHFNGECCKVNTPQANFLLLDARLFYGYMHERGMQDLKEKTIDLPYLLYLHDHTSLKLQIQKKFPKLEYYRIYIEMFFEMPTVQSQSMGLSLEYGRHSFYVREFKGANLTIFYKKIKHICLSTYRSKSNLQSRTFHCPCQNFTLSMTFPQFAAHLKNSAKHKPINLAGLFSND